MSKFSTKFEVKELILNKVNEVLQKPRVNAYSPESLVEVVRHLLSIAFEDKKIEKFLYKDSGPRAWWLEEGLTYEFVTNKLQKVSDFLYDDSFQS